MRYQIKQRLFSLRTRFDIADEAGTPILRAERKLFTYLAEYSIGSLDGDHELVKVRQRLALSLPKYDVIQQGLPIATICRRFAFRQRYTIEVHGKDNLWVAGSLFEHNYRILRGDQEGEPVATVSRAAWTLQDTYGIDVLDPAYDSIVLAMAVVIDHARSKRNQS